ncbi:hypothetical protein [Sporosarcina sp. D27]|uniref:hypothetical protein n=1 Tax=Sporosarcina sp. D27 TaxID=1382305 RepID=UPI00047291FD|nr:hypothetical protein [Sporosarcina sp. D27]
MTNNGAVKEIPDWIKTNRQCIENQEIVARMKVNHDQINRIRNNKPNYRLVLNSKLEKLETMDFLIRNYNYSCIAELRYE